MDFNNMKDFGFEDLNVRKSVFDMQVITLDTPYLGGLPPELEDVYKRQALSSVQPIFPFSIYGRSRSK